MVNVAHYRHYGSAGNLITFVINAFNDLCFNSIVHHQLHCMTHFFNHDGCCILVNDLVDGCHGTHVKHHFNHFSSLHFHTLS